MAKKRILLVPGFQNQRFDAWSKWQKLADHLKGLGHEVMVTNYSFGMPMDDPLESYAEDLEVEIRVTKNPDVIIAHSMGCLVTRSAVEEWLEKDVSRKIKLILIEGPHQGLPNKGISLARITAKIFEIIKSLPNRDVPGWHSWKDMQAGSQFIARLNDNLEERFNNNLWLKNDVSYYEIGGLLAYYFPKTFSLPAQIPCKGKMIFPKLSHSKLKSSPKVIDHIVKIIEDD